MFKSMYSLFLSTAYGKTICTWLDKGFNEERKALHIDTESP